MQYFINGTSYSFSTTLSAANDITSITNAAPPVMTAPVMPADKSIVLLKSGWGELNEQATFSGQNGELAGLDTTDRVYFPPGESAGSYQVAGGFTSLVQVREVKDSGGDTNDFKWGYIDDRSSRQRSKPTDKNPLSLTFTMDYDADLPWFDELVKLDRSRQIVIMRETLPNKDVLLYSGFMAFNNNPSRTRNENMTVSAVMTINSQILRFPASFFA